MNHNANKSISFDRLKGKYFMSLNKIFTDLEPKKLINIGQKWAIPATVHWPDSG